MVSRSTSNSFLLRSVIIRIKNFTSVILEIFSFYFIISACTCKNNEHLVLPEVNAKDIYNVKTFGAVGDGKNLDTDAINEAIDSCYQSGGKVVYFPAGTYLSGSIRLKNNITIYLSSAATILGAENDINAYDQAEPNESDKYQDYGHSHFHNALIWGEQLENILITGSGTIHGGGITRSNNVLQGGGDKAISLKLCNNVVIENITIKQGGHFAILATGCDNIVLNNLSIFTQRDGINIVSCRNVEIKNNRIESIRYENNNPAGGDDAIALKSDYSLGYSRSSENITIEDCILRSGCIGIQIGSETVGDFKNIRYNNIIIEGAEKAGIGITSNDGAFIDIVTISNITMSEICTPIFINITDRLRRPDKAEIGCIRNVSFSNVTATDIFGYINKRGPWTSTLNGMSQFPIEEVTFNNINMVYKGGGEAEWENLDPPDPPEDYSPRYLGIRPSYGFYCRHVKNISFFDVDIKYEKEDLRPSFLFKDVQNVVLENIEAQRSASASCAIHLLDVSNFNLHNSMNLPDVKSLDAQDTKY